VLLSARLDDQDTYLGNTDTRTGHNDRSCCRNVVCVPSVPSRAHNIHHARETIALFIRISVIPLPGLMLADARSDILNRYGVLAQYTSAGGDDFGRGI
jgi:hypothetical protein